MIVYLNTVEQFCTEVNSNKIADIIGGKFHSRLGKGFSPSEENAWRNSMQCMRGVLSDPGIPRDAGVAIEFSIPQTSKRIDFILTGFDSEDLRRAVIVELKQWQDVEATEEDAVVRTFLGGNKRSTAHPSYQAWTYAALLEDFNESVRDTPIRLSACAYLHNCPDDSEVKHDFYSKHLEIAPAFTKGENEGLRAFIKRHLQKGDKGESMYLIDAGSIRPSKKLADSLVGLIAGKQEFVLVDDQKLVYERALALADRSRHGAKHILIVRGGPGTGKSVVAINLLVELTKRRHVAKYVSKNSAPRAVYQAKLTGTLTQTRFNNLFCGSGSFVDVPENSFDVLIVDEAHRLNEKSGLYSNLGENQIKEIVHASKCTIFFIDEEQRIHFKDIGRVAELTNWAEACGGNHEQLELSSQFRCNGSDGYLAWLDSTLQVHETANDDLDGIQYDFRVFDSPNELRDAIEFHNQERNSARMVAGYCWKWVSKKNKKIWDFDFPQFGFQAKWNLDTDGSLWIVKPQSVKEIGCIHTCQGLEVDYIGVILGSDFVVRNGEVVADARKRAPHDKSVAGYKQLLRTNPQEAKVRGAEIVKNTYRTLMTRGQRGCFIWSEDEETREYFKNAMRSLRPLSFQPLPVPVLKPPAPLPLELLPEEEREFFVNCIPVFPSLKIAAGQWGLDCGCFETSLERAEDWIPLPKGVRPGQRAFVARVDGGSMEPLVPSGSWCVFGPAPEGSRSGMNLLVWHDSIHDPDGHGHYTLKRWESKKVVEPDESGLPWRHEKITLHPANKAYAAIVLGPDAESSVRVVAALLRTLPSKESPSKLRE
jgi:DUF2075 family protein